MADTHFTIDSEAGRSSERLYRDQMKRVVIFDNATGVVHVFVNGVKVIENGSRTRALRGRIVYGPELRSPGTSPHPTN